MKLAALSIDLDEIDCYHNIYGLPNVTSTRGEGPVYTRAVPRLAALLREASVPCTFFVIGHDVVGSAQQQLKALHDEHHELANHSFEHLYDLTRRDPDVMRHEVDRCSDVIEQTCGTRPVGFRAPGYTINDNLLAVLRAAGMSYDSSVFPCPPYYLAKASAIGLIRARGRISHSILDTPRVMGAPADPYVPASPWWESSTRSVAPHEALIELPIAVTRGLRLPFIGTSVMLAGPTGATLLTRMMQGRPLVNLELHGVDLLGADEDNLHDLAAYQRDLNISVARKLRTLRAVIDGLKKAGYEFVTLAQATRRYRNSLDA